MGEGYSYAARAEELSLGLTIFLCRHPGEGRDPDAVVPDSAFDVS